MADQMKQWDCDGGGDQGECDGRILATGMTVMVKHGRGDENEALERII